MPNAAKGPDGLTDKQRAYAANVAKGLSRKDAAKLAGYSDPDHDGYRLEKLPAIQRTIYAKRQARLQGEIGGLAFDRLSEALQPGAIPLRDQFQYVKLGLTLAGHDPKAAENNGSSDTPSADWTADQLATYIERLSAHLDGASNTMLDITPDAEPDGSETKAGSQSGRMDHYLSDGVTQPGGED